MKVAWYLLTVLFVAFGALKLFRVWETLAAGGGAGGAAEHLLLGLVVLACAWKALGNARSSGMSQST